MDPRERRTTKLTQYRPNARREDRRVLLIGASVRAGAQALARDGWQVIAADAFGDRDTHSAAYRTHLVDPYPTGLDRIARRYPRVPWCYLGALENRPGWLTTWARHAPLWGISGQVVRSLRDPWILQAVLREVGFACPDLQRRKGTVNPLATNCQWLRKPRNSGGGRGIDWESVTRGAARQPVYWQAFVTGIPRSGVFLASRTDCRLLGVTGALAEIDPTSHGHHQPFHYTGSWGPAPLTESEQEGWERLGQWLTHVYQLRGVFGVDAVMSGVDLMVLEVNPRLTASAEVLERTSNVSVMRLHVEQFSSGPSDLAASENPRAGRLAAKQVLYAPSCRRVTSTFVQWCEQSSHHPMSWPLLADIPSVGTNIRQGSPLLTAFSHAECVEELTTELQRRCHQVLVAWEHQPAE